MAGSGLGFTKEGLQFWREEDIYKFLIRIWENLYFCFPDKSLFS